MLIRKYTLLDCCLVAFDKAMQTLVHREYPPNADLPKASLVQETVLNQQETIKVSQFMRINHAGEIAAQALYFGQAFSANNYELRSHLLDSAYEEQSHLNWCAERLQELGSHTSYLAGVWYLGSLTIGFLAGLAGDKFSLGFIAETEHQVTKHLQGHLDLLPENDYRTRAILVQMQKDEINHGSAAMQRGGVGVSTTIKTLMRYSAKVMTGCAKYC